MLVIDWLEGKWSEGRRKDRERKLTKEEMGERVIAIRQIDKTENREPIKRTMKKRIKTRRNCIIFGNINNTNFYFLL